MATFYANGSATATASTSGSVSSSSSSSGSGCGFCKRNKEPESIYKSHQLKDQFGRVTCPQLFRYRCELCGSTGPEAHTRSYCPQGNALRQLPPVSNARNPNQHQPDSNLCTYLSSSQRMCRNMGKVTNSRYNSAGKLRRQHQGRGQQQHRQQPNNAGAPIENWRQSSYFGQANLGASRPTNQ